MARPGRLTGPSSLLAILVVLLCLNAGFWYKSIRRITGNEGWVSHTYEVLGSVEALFSTIKDAQRGARGYVLTPNERFFVPFEEAKRNFSQKFQEVQQLTSDNPRQQRRLARLHSQVDEYFSYLDTEIAARRNSGFDAAEALIRIGKTQQKIDELGSEIESIENEERSLLLQRQAQTQASIRSALLNFALATTVAFALLIFTYLLIVHAFRSRLTYAATLESTVQQRTAELQEANNALEAFNYSVSHDLRAPLRGMSGLGTALLEDYGKQLDETAQRYATGIVSAARKMDALIDGLLLYSRVSRTAIQVGPVPLASVVRDARTQLESHIAKRNAHISVRGPLPTVLAQSNLLVQAIANLISNAIKFQRPGITPEVTIWAETSDHKARLIVRDNGIGIAAEHQERIFAVFERLHGIEMYEGSGLGLSIVRAAMQRMSGNVGVRSQAGGGSDFWLELPLVEEK